jgi:putative ABC transport system ATP-binding protein
MLDIKNVSRIYGSGDSKIAALNDISFTVEEGNFLAVMGPSGSGKSTLLNVIGGLDRITSGEVALDGKRIDNLTENELVNIRRGKIAYIFQQYHLLPSLTAIENVMLPLVFGGKKNESRRAFAILERVGLGRRADHRPGQLSGGEQQRVAIARALVSSPELILADEPTGNMDQKTGGEILNLFEEINREGHTIIMVTHDPVIAKHAREVLQLKDGQIVNRLPNETYRGDLINAKKIYNWTGNVFDINVAGGPCRLQ